jgi:hypothetical protein
MCDDKEIDTTTATTPSPWSADPGANLLTSTDSDTVRDCGQKQDPEANPEANTAMNNGPGPAGAPQNGDQIGAHPGSKEGGHNQDPELLASGTSSLRSETARRDGSKSHGPTTEGGKGRSRMNALKHGLRAETLLLETSSEGEKAVFDDLWARLEEEFAPRTFEQHLLVGSMVHAIWQKRRCLFFETKELREDFIFHGPITDRLLRYATSADKRLFRALHELKRLRKEDPPQADDPDTAPPAEEE